MGVEDGVAVEDRVGEGWRSSIRDNIISGSIDCSLACHDVINEILHNISFITSWHTRLY